MYVQLSPGCTRCWVCVCERGTDHQLVTLPYNLLLQKNARDALGIDLSNQIVVIDEAHSQCSDSTLVLHEC